VIFCCCGDLGWQSWLFFEVKTTTIASEGHSINKKPHKKYYKMLEDFYIIRGILAV
jgi:hypothetical protein